MKNKHIFFSTVALFLITISTVAAQEQEISVSEEEAVDSQAQQSPEEEVSMLEGIQVIGRKPFIEQGVDRMVINPEASISAASDNVLDVLVKAPGVSIDKDGNVSLKGKSGITILIDDKPTYLSGTQLTETLQNMQASAVEKIEIIENPPAKYDAEGSSGIINIKTKRGQIRGWNGNVTLGSSMGRKFRENNGLDLNYRNEKWNFFGNFYDGMTNHWTNTDVTRNFPEGDGATIYENTKNPGRSYSQGLKFGTDYYFKPNHVIGIMGRYSGGNFKGDIYNITDIVNALNVKQSHEDTHSKEKENWENMSFNLNYKWSIDSAGRTISTDVDYACYDYFWGAGMNTTNTTYTPLLITNSQSNDGQHATTRLYSAKIDYEHPIGEKSKLETGLKSSLVRIDSEQEYSQLDNVTGEWGDFNNMSNRFKYRENINALYISWKQTLTEKLDMQTGLRTEQTNSQGNSITMDSITNRNYINVFPTLFLHQKFSDKHQLGLSYAYRISRPHYWAQNPIVWTLSPYTSQGGNAALQPEYTHSVKLSYTYNRKYILSTEYAHTKDGYDKVFLQDDTTRKTLITWLNMSTVNYANATLTIPVEIGKWCHIRTNMTMHYKEVKSKLEDDYVNNLSTFSFSCNFKSEFSLPKKWSIEISGWYRTKTISGVTESGAIGMVSLGVQKMLLKDKLTLRLKVDDILNTYSNYSDYYFVKYQNIDTYTMRRWDSMRIGLNLTWRFGKENIKPARQRTTGIEEEEGRTNK